MSFEEFWERYVEKPMDEYNAKQEERRGDFFVVLGFLEGQEEAGEVAELERMYRL